MFANNEWRDAHVIKENIVIIALGDLTYGVYLQYFMGLYLDIDLIMVNQVMFTFRRQSGYLLNNQTLEPWIWQEGTYASMLMNPHFDF